MRSRSKEHSTSQRMSSRTPGVSGVESDLSGKQRLQQALFPRGLTFDDSSIATPVTSSIFYAIEDARAQREEFGCPPGIRTPIACSRGRCPSR
jgi:hypothetical protein